MVWGRWCNRAMELWQKKTISRYQLFFTAHSHHRAKDIVAHELFANLAVYLHLICFSSHILYVLPLVKHTTCFIQCIVVSLKSWYMLVIQFTFSIFYNGSALHKGCRLRFWKSSLHLDTYPPEKGGNMNPFNHFTSSVSKKIKYSSFKHTTSNNDQILEVLLICYCASWKFISDAISLPKIAVDSAMVRWR